VGEGAGGAAGPVGAGESPPLEGQEALALGDENEATAVLPAVGPEKPAALEDPSAAEDPAEDEPETP
jgi:hypothetical protein